MLEIYNELPINSCLYKKSLIGNKNFFKFSYSFVHNRLNILDILSLDNINENLIELCQSFLKNIPEIYTDENTKTGPHINGLPYVLFFPQDFNLNIDNIVYTAFIEMAVDYEWNDAQCSGFLEEPDSNKILLDDIVLLGPGNNFSWNDPSGLFTRTYLYTLPNNPFSLLYYKFEYIGK